MKLGPGPKNEVGALAPLGPGPKIEVGALAPLGPGPKSEVGALAPLGPAPGPRRHWKNVNFRYFCQINNAHNVQ